MSPSIGPILHITSAAHWKGAARVGTYRDDSLIQDGFIHFSFPSQVVRVANGSFRGRKGLVVLVVDPDRLESPLRVEGSEPRSAKFPHLYGPLNTDAVVHVLPLVEGSQGFEPPEGLMLLPGWTREVDDFIARAADWVRNRSDVEGLALVGSWARDAARLDSDVDIVLLTTRPELYLETDEWVGDVGADGVIRTVGWGQLTERRLRLPSGLEIDLGITTPKWAATDPVDEGTRRVVEKAVRILHDPRGLLGALERACSSSR